MKTCHLLFILLFCGFHALAQKQESTIIKPNKPTAPTVPVKKETKPAPRPTAPAAPATQQIRQQSVQPKPLNTTPTNQQPIVAQSAAPAQATVKPEKLPDAGIRAIYAHNLGTFGNRFGYDAIGFGANLGFTVIDKSKSAIPLQVHTGLNFDYLWFGGRSARSGDIRINVNSNAYGWAPYLKVSLGRDKVKVFLFANAGLRFFYGKYKLTWNYIDGNGDTQTKRDGRNFTGDASFYTGLGGGLKLGALELRALYNAGRNAQLLDPGSIVIDNITGNLVSYNTVSSLTDMWLISLGLTIK